MPRPRTHSGPANWLHAVCRASNSVGPVADGAVVAMAAGLSFWRRVRIPSGSALALLGVLLTPGCERSSFISTPCESAAILEEFRSYSPNPIAPSPEGGARIVAWAKYNEGKDREGLIVTESVSGRVIQSMRAADPILRVNWRPDGHAIAYFRQESGTNRRQLFLWELQPDRHRELLIPLSFAQAFVRWAPDGTRLAFTNDRGGLVIVDPGAGTFLTYGNEHKIRSFDWASDSRRLAVAAEDARQAAEVTIVDAATAGAVVRVASRVGEVREVAWQGAAKLLLLVRSGGKAAAGEPARPTFTSIDPDTNQEKVLYSAPGNNLEPRWVPGGTAFLWHNPDIDGTQRIMLCSVATPRQVLTIEREGALNFRAFMADRKGIVVLQASSASNQLVQLSLDEDAPDAVLARSKAAPVDGVWHGRVEVRSADGTMVPIRVARLPEGGAKANAVLIRVHGNIPNPSAQWAESQLCLAHGVHWIQIGNRKPHGAQDLIAACDYAHTVLGVPRERIVVLGASTATGVALEAVARRPGGMGILALIGVLHAPHADSDLTASKRVKLLAFHGEKDRTIPPDRARRVLEEVFGSGALIAPRGLWHVFPGEDHTLKNDESFAVIHATILRELGLIECPGSHVNVKARVKVGTAGSEGS